MTARRAITVAGRLGLGLGLGPARPARPSASEPGTPRR